ncbi:cell envelope integrity protein TolA [Roseibaca sp. Y0-43]|uniref:cell envelope integrity protein TolA n=1 Tax=Roseibaca sp. Y0-43 TaxID=2816854 RepID=UPI001D0CB020|nr:cell envelope integrity protein TolA [Roseibaca sp. Y0-43]MCC1480225.1 TonB family protein [Roseibaca sp. Y0-43]
MMRAWAEIAGFGTVALAAHLAAFAAVAPDGMAAGGDGGAGAVTVAAPLGAADPALSAMVRAWTAPVAVAAPAEPLAPPAARAEPDSLPQLAPTALPSLPGMIAPNADAAPRLAAPDLPKLFDRPETPPEVRPRARPDPRAKAAAPAPRASAPAQRAGGQAASAQRGQGTAQVQSGGGNSASALAEWGGRIRAAVLRAQTRPRTNASGVVRLRLAVTAAGQLAGVSITGSSGNAALDQAAVRAVQRARLPRAPGGVSGTHQFNLPVGFR